MSTVLIISYYWPPLGGPGALRPVKFAKYLPRFGIEPVIITRKPIAYHSMDHGLQHDVRTVKTLRTETLDPARLLYLAGMRTYRPKTWQRPLKKSLNFPDHKIFWLPFAYHAARTLAFDSILVTAPPFSAFITGYLIAVRTGKPLILDFRDAWLEFPFMPYRGILQKTFIRYWEEKLTTHASRIIVVDDNIKESLCRKYPTLASRIHVIPNGYDPDDFVPAYKPTSFTVSYLGTVREERDPRTVLEAMDLFIKKYRPGAGEVTLKFIGHVEPRYRKELLSYPFVDLSGHLPYQQAVQEFCASHVGIMITTGDRYFFPSRQNEYLASGLPLIVCGRSAGIHLLENAFHHGYPGWIFGYHDAEGITKKIYEIYRQWKKGNPVHGKTPYPQYTRKNLTNILAGILKKIPQ
jgi:glycosyltransferase involved in cell wall biosynthesis